MTHIENSSIQGDRPLNDKSEDKLGFRNVAISIASALVDQSTSSGFVVGLEGKWGSGKSSLLYLIEDELKQLPLDKQPTVINFKPWLVGNRDSLLAYLFTALNKGIAEFELSQGDASEVTKVKARAASKALQEFAGGLGQFGGAVEFIGEASGFASVKWLGKGISHLRDLSKAGTKKPQLDKLKEDLTNSLKELGHRFVITIDDVDRLDPDEIIEILRLTRSVADLPNVIYLLCYDKDILAEGIKSSANVDGHAYLEKIVQLTVMVPTPEPFQLRNWLADELQKFAIVDGDSAKKERLRNVINHEGGRQLLTPRTVVKVLDSIRFYWPPLRDESADLADLVWLMLIKDGQPNLYRWIENYCGIIAARSIGAATVSQEEQDNELQSLLTIITKQDFADRMYRHYFVEQLPGFDVDYDENGSIFKIYQKVSDNEIDMAIRDKRLASPDHYRLYFALSNPPHALTKADYDIVWKCTASGVEDTQKLLLNWHSELVFGNYSKTDMLLERIRGAWLKAIENNQAVNLLISFANMMDAAKQIREFDSFGVNTIWTKAENLIRDLISLLDEKQCSTVISNMFQDGAAIGWLTEIFRRETFAHGRYGDRKRAEQTWYFSDEILDQVTEIMLDRYQSMTIEELLKAPDLLDILFAWNQAGDEPGPRDMVSKNIENDDMFLSILASMCTVRDSSASGRSYILKQEIISPFLDYDKSRRRIEKLSENEGPLKDRAKFLLQAFQDAI